MQNFIIFLLVLWVTRVAYKKWKLNLHSFYLTNPQKIILLSAIFASIISSYPVVFMGKSYLSPMGVPALYPEFPYIPGFQEIEKVENIRSSDVGAMLWSIAPNTSVLHDSLLVEHTLPLWNRYVGSGTPLFAQGITEVGDILSWIPILLDSSSIGWDIKFVLSKLIFSLGIGILIYQLTRNMMVSIALTISSCFLGFYAVRFNHPAYFSITYAPWIVIQWRHLANVITRGGKKTYLQTLCSVFFLTLATWFQLNAGVPKEGVITALFMHTLGITYFYEICAHKISTPKILLCLLIILFSLLFITAPYWLTFIDALNQSYTVYDVPTVATFPYWGLLGFFDNYFYWQAFNNLMGPSTNIIIWLGILFSLSFIFKKNITSVNILIALFLISIATAFGIIPEFMIIKIPFIKNIIHIGNTFSMPAMILGIILSGFGYVHFLSCNYKEKIIAIAVSVIFIFLIIGIYLINYPIKNSTLFYLIFNILLITAFCYHLLNYEKWNKNTLLIVMTIFILLNIRHGLHLNSGFNGIDLHVLNPMARGDYSVNSDAISYVKNQIEKETSPTRVIGAGMILFPGFNTRYRLEGLVSVEPLRNSLYEQLLTTLDYPDRGWKWLRYITIDQMSPDRSLGLDLLGTGFLLTNPGTKVPNGNTLVYSSDLDVWKRNSAWPRAFYTNRIIKIKGVDEIIDILKNNSIPFAAIYEEKGNYIFEKNKDNFSPGYNYKIGNNFTEFSVDVPGSGIVVLSEAYLPNDFILKVNGIEKKYIQVNHAFKGVSVESRGSYRFRFEYRPKIFIYALYMFVMGLLLIILVPFVLIKNDLNANLLKKTIK